MRATDKPREFPLRCVIACIFLALGSFSASADRRVGQTQEPAAARWDGFYIGGHAGAARTDTDWRYQNNNYFNTLGPILLGTDFDLGASGAIAGGQAGYNHQAGPWLFGIEATATASRLSSSSPSPFFPAIDTYQTKVNWLATAAARIGYAQGLWLGYAKGGWAGADVKLLLRDEVAAIDAAAGKWANGWTVGAGVEYALRPDVSLGIAYDHIRLDVDAWTIGCPLCGTGVGFGTPIVDGDITIHTLTARLNYRLGN
jgi:outer membrane immunogenic protein